MQNPIQPARLARILSGHHVHLWVTGFLLSGVVTALAMSLPSTPEPDLAITGVPPLAPLPEPARFIEQQVAVQRGDTVPRLIEALGIQDEALRSFLITDPEASGLVRRLRPGMQLASSTGQDGRLEWLEFRMPGSELGKRIVRHDATGLAMEDYTLEVDTREALVHGTIQRSLFAALDEQGLPDSLAIGMADIFGSQIDFNTDLRQGDQFSILYDSFEHQGETLRTGRIRAVEFINAGQRFSAYWYDDGKGKAGYYDASGRSLRLGFLRSPLEFTRISSGFSLRRMHPIHKQWRSHKGTDFAAPTGTRVRASSDGKVEFVGQQRGYGNFIVLRHAGGYTTAYGHLNGFARGLKKGQSVSQGDVIGFVGATGWATGPHLHYEFRKGEQHFDPMRVKLPGQPPLAGQRLQAFLEKTAPLVARLQERSPRIDLASN